MNRNSCIYWIGLLTEGSSVINAENFPFTFILQIALSPLVRFFLSISLSLSVIYAQAANVIRWFCAGTAILSAVVARAPVLVPGITYSCDLFYWFRGGYCWPEEAKKKPGRHISIFGQS